MGLFQDQTSSLSEIKRLAALVTDPSRRGEIGSDQWPLAMIAYGLVTCNETGREEEGVIIYNMFQSRCAPDARRKCALQLAAFIRQRQGDGWRALLPFAMADEAPDIRRQSAFLIYTLAAPQPEERFPGIAGLANVICASPCPGQASMAPALDALMSLGDMRFAPYLSFISKNLPPGRLADLLAETEAIPTDLGCGWLLDILDEHPELSSTIAAVLAGMPSRAGEVLDVVLLAIHQFRRPAAPFLEYSRIQAAHGRAALQISCPGREGSRGPGMELSLPVYPNPLHFSKSRLPKMRNGSSDSENTG